MADVSIALTMTIVDYPTTDASEWTCATQAALAVKERTGRPIAMVATLPELMPLDIATELMLGGVTPMMGLTEAIAAAQIAAPIDAPADAQMLPAGKDRDGDLLTEIEAKAALAKFGLRIPIQEIAESPIAAGNLASFMPEPLVLKGVGSAHKSEAGLVQLGLSASEIEATADAMPSEVFLIEEMVKNGVAELLVGIIRDPAHGFVLTLAAGGTHTEILADATSLMVPACDNSIKQALTKLRCYPLLTGFRGNPAADLPTIISAVQAIQTYVIENADTVCEVEINPLICTPSRAVAADALIRKAH